MRQSSSAQLSAATAQDMRSLGGVLGQALLTAGTGPLVIAIEGELGAGKTTLVGGLLSALGVCGPVRSPTYTLIEPYEAGGRQLYHIDLYRLSDPHELEPLDLPGLLAPSAVLLIEWPSRAGRALPSADLVIEIEYAGAAEHGRTLVLRAGSSAGDQLVEQVLAAKSQ